MKAIRAGLTLTVNNQKWGDLEGLAMDFAQILKPVTVGSRVNQCERIDLNEIWLIVALRAQDFVSLVISFFCSLEGLDSRKGSTLGLWFVQRV